VFYSSYSHKLLAIFQYRVVLLDRFLVIAHSYHMRPRILVTKKDLTSLEKQHDIEKLLEVYENMSKSFLVTRIRGRI
jgi:putative ribosome biogenesis GTPase RsgA